MTESEPRTETEAQQWTRLRQIMYQPSVVWLATDDQGRRWLTDQYVVYDVTQLEALYCYDSSYDVVWPDGAYQLMATGKERFRPRDDSHVVHIQEWLKIATEKPWYYTHPSEWSVAEHPGKAMLWVSGNEPCLFGESTWSAIHKHYPDVAAQYTPEGNLFRFSLDGKPFAYAAGIQIPEGQERVAQAIAEVA